MLFSTLTWCTILILSTSFNRLLEESLSPCLVVGGSMLSRSYRAWERSFQYVLRGSQRLAWFSQRKILCTDSSLLVLIRRSCINMVWCHIQIILNIRGFCRFTVRRSRWALFIISFLNTSCLSIWVCVRLPNNLC